MTDKMLKEELGQVFTKPEIAGYMVSLLQTPRTGGVLDPCFGGGAFLDALARAGYDNVTGYEIDADWHRAVSGRYPRMDLRRGDFLKAPAGVKYDAIIMNPPYIRQEKIDDLKDFGISKRVLAEDPVYAGLPRSANLYMYFVVKAVELLSDAGELVVIFPSSWTGARSGGEFQRYLDQACHVTDQIRIRGAAFEENALVEVFILRIQKAPGGALLRERTLHLEQGKLRELSQLSLESVDFGFTAPFSRIARIRRGLTTGANSIFINPKSSRELSRYLVPIISSPKSFSGYTTEHASTDRVLIVDASEPYNGDLRAYLDGWEARILAEKKPKALYDRIRRKEVWYCLRPFPCRGILFSYFVRNEMKFVLNASGHLVRDNFYLITPGEDVYLTLALLNNYFTFYQLEKAGKKYGAGLLKLQRYDLEALLFPDPEAFSEAEKQELAAAAKKLLETSNAGVLREITKLIADATGNDASLIERLYLSEKRHRLEQTK